MFKKKKTPYEIGRDGTVEELWKARKHLKMPGYAEVRKGARAGFRQGRFENYQTLLANRDAFKIDYNAVRNGFYGLIENQANSAAAIRRAVEKIPAQEKQELLNETLHAAVSGEPYKLDVPLVDALLKAGAEANAEFHGMPGRILAAAIHYGPDAGVIRLLAENGADFDDAQHRINVRPFWDHAGRREADTLKLETWRAEITGKKAPAAEGAAPGADMAKLEELVLMLAEQVKDLTERVEKIEPAPAKPAARLAPPKI